MRPLLLAAFYSGLCPIGPPPTYRPSSRAAVLGLLLSILWLHMIVGMMAYNFLLALDGDEVDGDDDMMEGTNATTWKNSSSAAAWRNSTTRSQQRNSTEEALPNSIQRVITSSSGAAVSLGFIGLFVGYLRKLRHLPRVFQLSDALPGKVRWKTALFVVELSVYTIPISAYILKSYYESHGVSHVEGFAGLGVLYSVEKFVILHLVTRVGGAFDEINRQLQAVGMPARARARAKARAADVIDGEAEISSSPTSAATRAVAALCELRRQHMGACNMLELVTRSYEVQVLSFLVAEFVLCVLLIYVQARNLFVRSLRWMDAISIVFMVVVSQLTTLLCATCYSTSNKGNSTAAVVHKLLNTRRFQGEEVQQLIYFSMQLTYRKVSVSPYDVVSMDYSLLHGMLSTVAMHVVILVQFNLTS